MPRSQTVQLDNWPFFTELSFLSCHNVGLALNDYQWPKLTTFGCRDEFLSTEDSRGPLRAVNTMLARFETLNSLILDLQDIEGGDPDLDRLATSLLCHTHNMKSLVLRLAMNRSEEAFLDMHGAIFDAIRRCTRLDELALWVPKRPVVGTCQVNFSIRYFIDCR